MVPLGLDAPLLQVHVTDRNVPLARSLGGTRRHVSFGPDAPIGSSSRALPPLGPRDMEQCQWALT